MDFQTNSPSDHGRFEQIISQFFLKTLHIILESRIPSFKPNERSGDLLPNVNVKKSDKWFNLALGDRPASLEKLQFWHRNLVDPMVIDIVVVQGLSSDDDLYDRDAFEDSAVETVIERWVVQYENHRLMPVHNGDLSLLTKRMYQKSIILFRCLCSMMRLLPAYKVFKHLGSSNQSCDTNVIYKVSSFGDPFPRAEENMMKQYTFLPLEAVNGRLCVSVSYKPDLSGFNLESSISFPPLIITDYVGSPATDRLRAFPSIEKVSRTSSFSLRGTRPAFSSPSERPHSWSDGIHGNTAYIQNNMYNYNGSSPVYGGSPTTSDYLSSPTNIQGRRVQNYRMPGGHHKATCYDESLSPPFTPSPTPSAPIYHLNHSPNQSRLRPESAPMTIPRQMLNRSPRYLSPNLSDPNRLPLPPLSPRSKRVEYSSHGSPSSFGNKVSRNSESFKLGESYSGIMNPSFGPKISKDSKDESGRFSGLLSSSSSPRKDTSRSSSRISFQDDLDECDFSCPFDVDLDPSDSHASQSVDARKGSGFSSSSSLGRKSQDAAVGALVHMLRTAPPLRQGSSFYSTNSQTTTTHQELNFGTASGFFMPRKAADALEELKSYKDMKSLLLSKSETPVFNQEDVQAKPMNIKGRRI